MNVPDAIARQIAHVAIKNYAAHSYLYYEKSQSVISDGAFDELCAWLLKNYSWIKPFDLNNYLDKGSLEAGTGFHLAGRVCGQTRDYALGLLPEAESPPEPPKAKKKARKPLPEDLEDLL